MAMNKQRLFIMVGGTVALIIYQYLRIIMMMKLTKNKFGFFFLFFLKFDFFRDKFDYCPDFYIDS